MSVLPTSQLALQTSSPVESGVAPPQFEGVGLNNKNYLNFIVAQNKMGP